MIFWGINIKLEFFEDLLVGESISDQNPSEQDIPPLFEVGCFYQPAR